MSFVRSTLCLGLVLAGCAAEDEADAAGPLRITQLDDSTIAGSFEHGASLVRFESSSVDQQHVRLVLDVDGKTIEASYDMVGILDEDGHLNAFDADDRAALVALRDAVQTEHAEVVIGSLQGMFLTRHADWIADAPDGYTFGLRMVDVQDRLQDRTTHDDDKDTTCLWPGAWYYAYYDQGNGGAQWQWLRQANSGSCLGRCGAGCNWFDDDIMLDCFEHDSCVDHLGGSTGGGNSNCGDEYDHAVAEYIVTYAAWCPY
jgi:hypothetical protein